VLWNQSQQAGRVSITVMGLFGRKYKVGCCTASLNRMTVPETESKPSNFSIARAISFLRPPPPSKQCPARTARSIVILEGKDNPIFEASRLELIHHYYSRTQASIRESRPHCSFVPQHRDKTAVGLFAPNSLAIQLLTGFQIL
jgi:hypothetical protein